MSPVLIRCALWLSTFVSWALRRGAKGANEGGKQAVSRKRGCLQQCLLPHSCYSERRLILCRNRTYTRERIDDDNDMALLRVYRRVLRLLLLLSFRCNNRT